MQTDNPSLVTDNEGVQAHRQAEAVREADLVVPVIQEELNVQKRQVVTGRVRINKTVKEHEEVIEEPLLREDVVVEHVPINQLWEAGSVPEVRYEGDTLILPILEEVVVVEKRLMLKEELHIRRVQKAVQEPQHITLRSEEVTVERIEPTQAPGEIPRA